VRSVAQVKALLRAFAPLQGLGLPSMPNAPIVVVDEVGRPRPLQDANYEGGMSVCVGNVHCNDGFFDVTLSIVVNNVVRGAWGAALINLELYDLHVRPLVARAAAKQRAAGGVAFAETMRNIRGYTEEKSSTEGHIKPHWDVLLKWAQINDEPRTPGTEVRDIERSVREFGVGPWEEDAGDASPAKPWGVRRAPSGTL
jgi:hypothetical protein